MSGFGNWQPLGGCDLSKVYPGRVMRAPGSYGRMSWVKPRGTWIHLSAQETQQFCAQQCGESKPDLGQLPAESGTAIAHEEEQKPRGHGARHGLPNEIPRQGVERPSTESLAFEPPNMSKPRSFALISCDNSELSGCEIAPKEVPRLRGKNAEPISNTNIWGLGPPWSTNHPTSP